MGLSINVPEKAKIDSTVPLTQNHSPRSYVIQSCSVKGHNSAFILYTISNTETAWREMLIHKLLQLQPLWLYAQESFKFSNDSFVQ